MSETSSREAQRAAEHARDRALVARILGGDVDAFQEVVEAYQQAVYNLAYRMLGDPYEAEDVSQEAFIRAYRNLHRYDPERSFKTWLLSITSNYCIDRLRRRRLIWLSIDDPLPPHPALTSDAIDPEDAVAQGEHSALVQDLLGQLPPDYRLVVVLRYWYDFSYTEIAVATDTTESAVKSRLFRARRALAEMIGPRATANVIPAMEG